MKLDSIELQGFGSYRGYNSVKIPDGISGIIGQYDSNERRSNGAGKSSLIMTIIYALFGEGEFSKLEEIVNDSLGNKEMFVKLHFELNGQNYKVERGRKGTSSYLDFFENNSKLGDSIINTQSEIIRVLGMDYKMLTASNFFEQGNIDKFINVTPEERRSYVDKILNLEIWRIAYKNTNKDLKDIKEKKVLLEITIKDQEDKISLLKSEVVKKAQIESDIIKKQEEKKVKQTEIEKYSLMLLNVEKLKKLRGELERGNVQLLGFDQKIDDFDKEIELGDNELKHIKEKITTIGTTDDFDDKELDHIKNEKKLLESDLFNINNNINECNIELVKVTTQIQFLEKSKQNMKEGICPTCFQQVSLGHLDMKHVEFSEKGLEFKTLELEYTQNLTLFKDNEKIKEKGIKEYNERIVVIENFLSMIEKEKITLQNIYILKEKDLVNIQLRKKQFIESKLELESRIKETTIEIDILKKEIPDFIPDESVINQMRVDVSNFEKDITILNMEIGRILQLEKNAEEIQDELGGNKRTLKNAEESIYIYNVLVESFQEIPRQIFIQSVKDIEDAANELIQQILPEITVRIYEDGTRSKRLIITFNVSEKPRGYKRLSGGERVVVNIGLRLGFSKVIRSRSNTNIDFVVLDEPFGFLDDYNKELVSKVLALMLHWFNQVLIISHVNQVQDFPQIITVRKTIDNISYIA